MYQSAHQNVFSYWPKTVSKSHGIYQVTQCRFSWDSSVVPYVSVHNFWMFMFPVYISSTKLYFPLSHTKKMCTLNDNVTEIMAGNCLERKTNLCSLNCTTFSRQKCMWNRHMLKTELNYQAFFCKWHFAGSSTEKPRIRMQVYYVHKYVIVYNKVFIGFDW